MKILALDIGDVWTGSALSDSLGLLARPYKTVQTTDLIPFIQTIIAQEPVTCIVVGHPKTLGGKLSEQTKKVEQFFDALKKEFTTIQWLLWDERFTSQQADQLKRAKTKEEKIHAHSLAAAFILSSYLDYRHFHQISS